MKRILFVAEPLLMTIAAALMTAAALRVVEAIG